MLSIPDIFLEELLLSLGFCEKCCRERQQEEYSSQFTYISKAIYVRKVTEETRSKFADTLNASKSPTVTAPASDGEGITDEGDDIYFTTVCLIIYIVLVVWCWGVRWFRACTWLSTQRPGFRSFHSFILSFIYVAPLKVRPSSEALPPQPLQYKMD